MDRLSIKKTLIDGGKISADNINTLSNFSLLDAALANLGLEGKTEEVVAIFNNLYGVNVGVDNDTATLLNQSGAIVITPQGDVRDVAPGNGRTFSLKEMYRHIGCDLIENVYLSNKIMVIDEEGALKASRELNWKATQIYATVSGQLIPIFGNVIIMNDEQQR